jgi:hypothetical protein
MRRSAFALACTASLVMGTAGGAARIDEALRAEIEAEWARDDRDAGLSINPTGEPQGATTQEDAAGGVDGVKDGGYGFHTTFSLDPWWQVDLGQPVTLDRVIVYNRCEGARLERAAGMRILVSLDGATWSEVFQHSGPVFGGALDDNPLRVDLPGRNVTARWVRCQVPRQVSFHLDEVEVYGADDPDTNVALGKPADQSSAGRWSRPKPGVAPQAGQYDLDHTTRVIARGRTLLAELRRLGLPAEQEGELAASLEAASSQLAHLQSSGGTSQEARREARFAARAAVRRIALANPLLDFDDVLFVQRHPGTFAHMCDQYYGGYARPGGGLFVLEDFRDDPKLRDVIGDQLPEGSFLSPDLSPDGRAVAFAYVAIDPSRSPDYDSAPEHYYHIYTVNIDGTGLRQLTDGPYDEFDPCWLPDGDIVFISTRRGGFCRCGGRPVPTYTLHRIGPDGSGIRRLSVHETNEWHPAVANDGALIYTRWDYVDRHTNLAHSLWRCLPDGSDAMAFYGNYNVDKKPWGEWHPQPVPGSHKVMAVAGAHHGYAYGSLVLVDPAHGQDGQTPVERLTPEVPFPEAEGFPSRAYTTPFPLSEDLWLVSYSPGWSTRDASHTVTQGIYLQDRFGNRELLYRDPRISALSPIPVRARPWLNEWPQTERDASSGEGRFLLLNVHDSLDAFPPEEIQELRVVQILPKTTYVADQPKIGAARQISARQLLGTVPVEEDGSAYFSAPTGVPLYFQAVDAHGMAVQTMRSITYLQPGETRSCVGCHEPRDTTPASRPPLAATRTPSAIQPGPNGSRPFSYARLVQPVLDRHCVSCHGANEPAGSVRLTGDYPSDSAPHSFSYASLARRDLVHWFDSVNGGEWIPLSPPGEFGARASRLITMLRNGHEGVVLPPEDLQRLCLWIDLNCPFYGAYEPEHVAIQRKGGVVPLEELLP